MFCDRCDQPIRGEKTVKYPIDGANGAGAIVVMHARLCKRAPRQTAPTSIRR